ncbi:tryptophan halogenase [Sphingomonas naasensis]|uniref:Tryptophan 7-halogenase n=1 Tax=Sphingomonas naasensis TaxID=1344951 RepID=A0A4S1WU42_9SPHN|nr:tryptophan halogenase family protein [Sphingomonas naasensis]NIJ19067.1 tryptophan halogenase [Sphingomonas naasensis]TGX46265.1 tryptophan 7-halogenase [Sphingomonas naasensis]
MSDQAIRSILIVGGGTAGWISAAVLARFLDPARCTITLIESEEIGTIGVGEATVPLMQHLNGLLGIDEREFVRATQGSFKLGIEFRDWGRIGDRFFHGFGDYGDAIEGVAPHQHWLKLRGEGDPTPIDAYSLPWAMAERGRFAPPSSDPAKQQHYYRYAFHFDALLYARFLRNYCEQRGVRRIEGRVVDAALDGESGRIAAVITADGERHAADLFIDCSGFRGLLIEEALGTGYEDWRHWLPCDSAVVAPSALAGPPAPYTLSTAREAGWQWRIPLQHRMGNGYVYASGFTDDARARDLFTANVEGALLADPRLLRFTTGRRKRFWNRNCVAIGLAGGFMEPLESTSIQLIQTAIARLIEYFPDRNWDPRVAEEYNRVTTSEFERIRDFLILHYCLTRRDDAPLWDHCRAMALPDTLAHKIATFRATGRVPLLSEESYQEPSWVAIFAGNGLLPDRYDPLVDRIDRDRLRAGLAHRRQQIAEAAEATPPHGLFLNRCCRAEAA